MKRFNYPITVYLKDAKNRMDNLPFSLTLIGEAEITRVINNTEERSKSILALEGRQWYPIEFIENNYKTPSNLSNMNN